MIKPRFDTVPEELKNQRQWILWKLIMRNGKEIKMPWSVYDQPASSTDPATWHEFECAVMRYDENKHAGIGYVFQDGGGYIGIDLDSCRHPETKEVAPWAKRYVDMSPGYIEVSPSGTGVKIWERSDARLPIGKNIKINEQPLWPGKKPGIEVYSHGRYFAVTGHIIKGFRE